jgi:hypothetical protein
MPGTNFPFVAISTYPTQGVLMNINQGCSMETEQLTVEQRVVVKVCDEWLQEAGLPLYSELVKKNEKPEQLTAPAMDMVGLV